MQPGAIVRAVFPRMMGKARPGVIVHVDAPAGRVVAVPMTSVRTNQPGRAPIGPLPAAGVPKRCWLLPASAAVFPLDAIEEVLGTAPPEIQTELRAAMARWFGPDWTRTDPALRGAVLKPRLLHPKKRPTS